MLALRLIITRNSKLASCAVCITRNFAKASDYKSNSFLTYECKKCIFISQKRFHLASVLNESDRNVKADDLQLVYRGELTSRMKAVKVFSLSTSLMGIVMQPMIIEEGMKAGGIAMTAMACVFVGFFTFATPLLLHFITKKYVTEIYYNSASEEYTATTISILLQKVHTTFYASDVKVPEVPGLFTTFMVGKKSFFLNPSTFDNPHHYAKIMGYDKPIDFKLNVKNVSTATKRNN